MGRKLAMALAMASALESLVLAAATRQTPRHPAVRAALARFAAPTDRQLEHIVARLRRPAPGPLVRAHVLATLPAVGIVQPTPTQARKIAGLGPVLSLFGRQFDLDFHLFTVGRDAWFGLYARSVLLMTREGLDLLSPPELAAITAHELAHDLIWQLYEDARRRRATATLQELELWCDGISVLVLLRLGHDADDLVRALTRLGRHNGTLHADLSDARYVALVDRTELIRGVAVLAAHDALLASGAR